MTLDIIVNISLIFTIIFILAIGLELRIIISKIDQTLIELKMEALASRGKEDVGEVTITDKIIDKYRRPTSV